MDILFFGDSNTYGYNPEDTQRFSREFRFTGKLQSEFFGVHNIIEEGLCGRTTVFSDPLCDDLCGINYISPCIKTHSKLDMIVIMLGTNDVKERFNANASVIALGMKALIEKIINTKNIFKNKTNILLICPPPIKEGVYEITNTMGRGCEEKSRQLARFYEEIAKELGVDFINAGDYAEFSDIDKMHFDKIGHEKMFQMLCEKIK